MNFTEKIMGSVKNNPDQVIYVCTGSKCKKKGGKQISKQYKDYLKKMGLKNRVEVIRTDCTDRCDFAPVVCFQPQNEWHLKVDENQAEELIIKSLKKLD